MLSQGTGDAEEEDHRQPRYLRECPHRRQRPVQSSDKQDCARVMRGTAELACCRHGSTTGTSEHPEFRRSSAMRTSGGSKATI